MINNQNGYKPFDAKKMNQHTQLYSNPQQEQQSTSFLQKVGGLIGKNFKEGNLNGFITTGSNILSNALSNGMDSNTGNVMSSLGTMAAALPGPVGAGVSAGFNILGGITNALWGSKVNQQFVNTVRNQTQQLSNTEINASNNSDLVDQASNITFMGNVKKSDVGKEGLFSNKVTNLTRKINKEIDYANLLAQNSILNSVNNIRTQEQLGRNYAAFGGYLNNKKAFGGNLLTNGAVWDNGVTVIGNGGTHEENPMEGVPMGVDEQGVPNLVEEGEVIFNDYVFSNRLSPTKEMKKKYKYKGDTFADVAKNLQKESEERPNDPISKRGLQDSMLKLQNLQEIIRQDNENTGLMNKFNYGGPKSNHNTNTNSKSKPKNSIYPRSTKVPYFPINRVEPLGIDESWNTTSSSNSKISRSIQQIPLQYSSKDLELNNYEDKNDSDNKKSFDLSSLRYAPVLGAAIGLSNSLFNKPDYSSADALLKASRDANRYSPISYSPIGDYMQYNPFDRDFYATKLRDNFAATNRALLDSSQGSRAAAASSLLSNNYNYQTKLGDLYRQAEEYNLAQKQKVADFNRATNMANAEMGLKVSMANQDALMKSRQGNYQGIMNAIQMRDAIDARRGASLNANLSNLFTSLGNVGIDYHNRKDRDFYIENVAPNLPLSEIDRLYGREAVNKAAKDRGISQERLKELGFSKGGKLNIKNKKRKGFTI